MRKIFGYFILVLLILTGIISANFIFASTSLPIVINEIAWMGTEASKNDEWLELYNPNNSPVNLEGWHLSAVDGSPEIRLSGLILPNGFYLLERTNEESLPGIPADQIYKGALNNQGEKLGLYNKLGQTIDLVDCSAGWFAGDNSTKQTMERKNFQLSGSSLNNWQTSRNSGGTPKMKNSIGTKAFLTPFQETEKEKLTQSNTEKELAAEDGQVSKKSSLLTSFFLAVFSGTIILILKRNIKVYNKSTTKSQ